ncbi:MAG TPA: GNAT family N-acetyltransferase [Nordella sp.]|nr:GNAT family N-acetyltransferase [Nordella sp.]
MTIELETTRLRLRPTARRDRDDLVALEQDPEVMRFLSGDFLKPRGGEAGVWTALEKSSQAFVGWFALYDRGDGTGELGYRLRRAMWGSGYASEGARKLVDFGFAHLALERIVADAMAVNQASRRVMERAGLVYVRTTHPPGAEHGDVEYEITRTAWSRWAR